MFTSSHSDDSRTHSFADSLTALMTSSIRSNCILLQTVEAPVFINAKFPDSITNEKKGAPLKIVWWGR